MADLTGMLQAAAGAAGEENLYIEDVFSTYLYTGTGAAQTITNDIDLDGEGGLVWIKNREETDNHILTDTERGATEILSSNTTPAEATDADTLTAFNSDGFALGADDKVNTSTEDYVSWTFRKAPKFFDVVTYTGTGSARTVAHNLGSVPGCIIVKGISGANSNWMVYHRANTAAPETDYLKLNGTDATSDLASVWNDTAPTDTEFTVGDQLFVNASGVNYVAYLWAHDAGGFGDDGLQNVVTCGAISGQQTVNIGFEPQWILIKRTDSTGDWRIVDNIRGFTVVNSDDAWLEANTTDAEAIGDFVAPTSTGFFNDLNGDYIYIAIRRGPMKTPTAGTEVFALQAPANTNIYTSGFPVDLLLRGRTDASGDNAQGWSRLTGAGPFLLTSSAGTGNSSAINFDSNTTVIGGSSDANNTYRMPWMFRRAPGFFDVVAYTGTGANRTVAHNLGVVPELMFVKNRSQADAWAVYAGDNTDYLVLNTTAATADLNTYWNDTSPTSTNFTVGTVHNTNASAENYVAYLFATLAGISKVGTYTGTGTTLQINCGFSAGARFILIKRTDNTSPWFVWDTARGIIAGNDPYLRLNSTAGEVTNTDYIDPLSSGFEITSTAPSDINASGGTFVFLAIA